MEGAPADPDFVVGITRKAEFRLGQDLPALLMERKSMRGSRRRGKKRKLKCATCAFVGTRNQSIKDRLEGCRRPCPDARQAFAVNGQLTDEMTG